MPHKPKKTFIDKIFEKLPPFVGIFSVLVTLILSYFVPVVVAYYIIIINVYFLYKSGTFALFFTMSMLKLRHNSQINWKQKLQGLRNIDEEVGELRSQLKNIKPLSWEEVQKDMALPQSLMRPDKFLFNNQRLPTFLQKFLFKREKQKTLDYIQEEIDRLENYKKNQIIDIDEINHVVMIPHYKEPLVLMRQTLRRLSQQDYYDLKKIHIVLGAEAADPNGVKVSEQLKSEFENVFGNIWITNHVLGEDEIVGKSSNMAWMGRHAVEEIKKQGWDLAKTTVTSCDADSKLPSRYFSYVTYLYVTIPDSEYKFYNGAMVFYNNIWRIPFYARVKNSMSTIYNVARLVRTDKLFPFSTYTTSFWLVKEIGYWTPWVTPEDYHLFFKALFKFDKKVSCVPLFIKIMSDAAEGDNHIDTILNNYKQERRWAWGISDDGWVIKTMVNNWKRLSLKVKYMATHVIFDHVVGLTGAAIVFVGANIPPLINPVFNNTVIGVRLPGVASGIVRFTLIFMVIIVILDLFLKPRPKHNPWWRPIMRIVEWVTLPIASFTLSVLPGLEAHTRLLFGRYLEYYVTKKKGVEENEKLGEKKS